MTDLVTWLRQQLDADEQTARAATGGRWVVGPTFGGRENRVYVKPEGPGIDTIGTCVIAGQVSNMQEYRATAEHVALHDPDRTLAEVAAKRAILAEHADDDVYDQQSCVNCYGVGFLDWPCPTVRLLALPYASNPGYDESWRPA